jgi:hypothetical protein
MKVKLFQSVVHVSGGNSSGGSFDALEREVNNFLGANPQIRIVDIKLTSNAAPVGNVVTNYGIIALMIYEESVPPTESSGSVLA